MWVADSDDAPGLATGAETLDALVEKLKVVIPELLEANGLLPADHPATSRLRSSRNDTSWANHTLRQAGLPKAF